MTLTKRWRDYRAEHEALAAVMRATMPACARRGCSERNDGRYGPDGSPHCPGCREGAGAIA